MKWPIKKRDLESSVQSCFYHDPADFSDHRRKHHPWAAGVDVMKPIQETAAKTPVLKIGSRNERNEKRGGKAEGRQNGFS